MAEDAVRRAGSVPTMSGFAGRHPEQQQQRQQDAAADADPGRRSQDEVCLHSDPAAARRLLRERVLACTRARLGIGQVSVPVFAEVVDNESIGGFLSRVLSDQNQLAACAGPTRSGGLRQQLTAAFVAGLAETRELLAAAPGDGAAAVEQVAAEFDRRLAELDS